MINSINNFAQKNPDYIIYKTEINFKKGKQFSIYIYYYDEDNNSDFHFDNYNYPLKSVDGITKKELEKIHEIFTYKTKMNILKIKEYKNRPNILLIFASSTDGGGYCPFIIEEYRPFIYIKESSKIYHLYDYHEKVPFDVFLLYLSMGYFNLSNFYHDSILEIKDLNLENELDLIRKSIVNLGFIITDEDKEKLEIDDFKNHWNNNTFLPEVDLSNPKIFRDLFDSDRYTSENYFDVSYNARKIRRLQKQLIRSKYKIKDIEYNNKTRDLHHLYSVFKVFLEYKKKDKIFISQYDIAEFMGGGNQNRAKNAIAKLVSIGILKIEVIKNRKYYSILK